MLSHGLMEKRVTDWDYSAARKTGTRKGTGTAMDVEFLMTIPKR